MSRYRHRLPHLHGNTPLLTDGGLETTLIFHDHLDLPHFASFTLLQSESGRAHLRQYFERYITIAQAHDVGMVLEAPTWRANADWGKRLGYDATALDTANRTAIHMLAELRHEHERPGQPMIISGNLGPRGDGYRVDTHMSVGEAAPSHAAQIASFAASEADLVSAFTMNYVEEAIGVVQAARRLAMPVVISFTVEVDGRLPSGETLAHAIQRTDMLTEGYVAYFMVNCAHPQHIWPAMPSDAAWVNRIGGLRANASRCSHAELDAATELDAGDPQELGQLYAQMCRQFPKVQIVGGCCGTDDRHITAIIAAVTASKPTSMPLQCHH
jgi:S-methylmethionine-dependent homocysteine/selenocysteine methylase